MDVTHCSRCIDAVPCINTCMHTCMQAAANKRSMRHRPTDTGNGGRKLQPLTFFKVSITWLGMTCKLHLLEREAVGSRVRQPCLT